MKNRTALPLLVSFAFTGLAAATPWTIDSNHSAAHFGVRHLMVSTVRGEFGKVVGTISFDEADPSKSTVEATIDATTINTQVASRDNDLKSDNFFDVAKYPTITFKSTKVTAANKLEYTVDGDLTMHGVTKPVTLHVEVTPAIKDPKGNERRGAEATTKLNRKDFGITADATAVGDEVQVIIDIEATHKPESAK